MVFLGYVKILVINYINMLLISSTDNMSCPSYCTCPNSMAANCPYVNITDSMLKSIPTSIEHLDLSHNNLESVPNSMPFYNELTILNLSYNKIRRISRYSFEKMWKLEYLDLSQNSIVFADLESTAFIANVRLHTLNLSGNPLANLGDGYDQILYINSLLNLDVSRCSITHIHLPLSLQGLTKLQHLNVSKNPVTHLDSFISDSLIALDISDCNIQNLRADSFEKLTKLETLIASRNAYLTDQYTKPHSDSLLQLDISYCSAYTNYASEFPNIKIAILKGNLIKMLTVSMFANNTKVEILDLSKNSIYFIDELVFYGAENLKYLDLSDNSISTFNDNTFTFTPLLTTLNLSGNVLNRIDQPKASSVVLLDVSRCHISELANLSLVYLPSLLSLNVSHNPIKLLPENLTSYSLQQLDVSYCRLHSISSFHIHQMQSLKDINLAGNSLVYLKNSTFASNKLEHIQLDDNPWTCNCQDDNFKTVWKFVSKLSGTTTELFCLYPENVTGKSWAEACAPDPFYNTRKRRDIVAVFVIAIALLIGGLLACFVAIQEHRKVQTETTQMEIGGDGEGETVNNESPSPLVRISESVRKLTQLPSYDEALLLPKPNLDDEPAKIKKRQSATQTEEVMDALLQVIEDEQQLSNAIGSRQSLQELEYVNVMPNLSAEHRKRRQSAMQAKEAIDEMLQNIDNEQEDNKGIKKRNSLLEMEYIEIPSKSDTDGSRKNKKQPNLGTKVLMNGQNPAAMNPNQLDTNSGRRQSIQEMEYINMPVDDKLVRKKPHTMQITVVMNGVLIDPENKIEHSENNTKSQPIQEMEYVNVAPKPNRDKKKRQSGTQTDEVMDALLDDFTNEEKLTDDNDGQQFEQEIEYVNAKSLRVQCTEL